MLVLTLTEKDKVIITVPAPQEIGNPETMATSHTIELVLGRKREYNKVQIGITAPKEYQIIRTDK